jgi:hypothetical protein
MTIHRATVPLMLLALIPACGSDDRFQSAGKDAKKVRWSVDVLDYQDQEGLRIADRIRSTWHPDKGDFEYFRGRIAAVRFNAVGEP